MATVFGQSDAAIEQVAAALRQYEEAHPGAEGFVVRYNPAAIRIKIVDERFRGKSKGDRHDYVVAFLSFLPEDVWAEISILLCLEPGERSFLDHEFDQPSRSYS